MKRIPILAFLLSAATGGAFAATLNGTVTNNITGAPVAGQAVYVLDSIGTWKDTVITNASGAYSFNVPATVPTGHPLMAYTAGCGGMAYWNGAYSGSSMTANFTSCTGTGNTLHGTVSLGSTANNGQAMIYLINEYRDTVTHTSILTAIDSFLTASTGGTFSKTYATVPGGKLLLKAALRPTHPAYASFLPTYYSSSVSWSSAAPLSASNFGTVTTNINMIGGTNPGGPGFISGDVLLGANKSAAVGDPMPGKIMILADAANKPMAYTYTDAKGHFEFNNLPFGTYRIFGDVMGKANPALEVSMPTTTPKIAGIVFEESSTSFKGHINALGTGIPAELASVKVFPNPATNYVQVDGLAAVKGDKTITVRGVNGAVISSQTTSSSSLRIATDQLPAGMYILQVATGAATASFRFVK
jgi:hypothetical protein